MNSLSCDKISSEHQLWGDKDRKMGLLRHEDSSVLNREPQSLITQKRNSENPPLDI